MQTYCIFVTSNFGIHPQMVIVWCLKQRGIPILIANKIFHVTVILLVYNLKVETFFETQCSKC